MKKSLLFRIIQTLWRIPFAVIVVLVVIMPFIGYLWLQCVCNPKKKIYKEFAKGVVLTNLDLSWDKEHKAWYSKGRFGLGSIGKHQVNSIVTGYLEIKKGKGHQYSVNLYIELNDRVWYYMSFEKNKLLTVSSNQLYNDIIIKKNTRANNEI